MFGPFVFACGAILWVVRTRTLSSSIALAGAVFLVVAGALHVTISSVQTIALGGMQPVVGENPLVVFFYLHGAPFGQFLIGLALVCAFAKGRPNRSFQRTRDEAARR